MHFNENANREQATTLDGNEQWKIKNPKAKKGISVACPLKTEATFGTILHIPQAK